MFALRDLSDNSYYNFSDDALAHVSGLTILDLRDNPDYGHLPYFYANPNLTYIHVDSGFTCCIFENEYEPSKGNFTKL